MYLFINNSRAAKHLFIHTQSVTIYVQLLNTDNGYVLINILFTNIEQQHHLSMYKQKTDKIFIYKCVTVKGFIYLQMQSSQILNLCLTKIE